MTKDKVHKLKGSSLLDNFYDGSMLKALAAFYPRHDWEWWRSVDHTIQQDYWKSKANNSSHVRYLSSVFQIQKLEDWYNITATMLKKIPVGKWLLKNCSGSICKMLASVYPDMVWEFWPKFGRASQAKGSVQSLLKRILVRLGFEDVMAEYKVDFLCSSGTKKHLPLDLYSPSKKIAFEYQGKHHFVQQGGFPFAHYSQLQQQQNDDEKCRLCERHGITLIIIPFWWDKKESSLVTTIRHHRPDLLDDQHSCGTGHPVYDTLVTESCHRFMSPRYQNILDLTLSYQRALHVG